MQYEPAINEYCHLIRTGLPLLIPPGTILAPSTLSAAVEPGSAGPQAASAAAAAAAHAADLATATAVAVQRWRDCQLSALLLGRSQAYAALSHHLRAIPAAEVRGAGWWEGLWAPAVHCSPSGTLGLSTAALDLLGAGRAFWQWGNLLPALRSAHS